ncbi:hypothetical protein ACFQ3Z_44800 [Streptomyces nogalater]
MPEHVPDVVQQALAAGDPAATADANVLRFTAHCHLTAGRHDEGEAVLEGRCASRPAILTSRPNLHGASCTATWSGLPGRPSSTSAGPCVWRRPRAPSTGAGGAQYPGGTRPA